MKRNQNGAVDMLLVAALLVVLIIGGLVIMRISTKDNEQPATSDSAAAEEMTIQATQETNIDVGAVSYTDEAARYSLEYPENWTISTEETASDFEEGAAYSTVVLTSSTGLSLTLEHNFGGRGGACEPASTDEPHATGNVCPTSELIYAESIDAKALGIDETVEATGEERFKEYDAYLVRTKHTSAGDDAETTYYSGIGIDTEITTIQERLQGEPLMGLYVPFSVVSLYSQPDPEPPVSTGYYIDIKMSPQGTSEDFFAQQDVMEAEGILRSLKFNQ